MSHLLLHVKRVCARQPTTDMELETSLAAGAAPWPFLGLVLTQESIHIGDSQLNWRDLVVKVRGGSLPGLRNSVRMTQTL